MNRIAFLFIFFVSVTVTVVGQKNPVIGKLHSDISLSFEGYDGTNSCSVSWNPDKQLYYAVFAGNADYPLETFAANGTNVHAAIIGVDIRGLWYNPAMHQLEGMSFDGGYFRTPLDNSGNPQSPVYIHEAAVPGGEQSVWQFNTAKGETYKYVDGNIYAYSKNKFKLKSTIQVGALPCDLYDMNYTSVIYTGNKNYEFGLLDLTNYQVHMVNKKGQHTASLDLPEDTILNEAFCFSFANDRIWLYDIDNRTWYGYPAFF